MKLVSKVYVEEAFKKQISLGQYSRSKTINVLSLADFDIAVESEETLKVRKSRDSDNSNKHLVLLEVPMSVTKKFSSWISLTNQATGEVIRIPVYFDPQNASYKPA